MTTLDVARRPGRFRVLPDDPEIGWTPFAWLIYLVPFVVTPFMRGDGRAGAAAVAATAFFLVLYFLGFWSFGRRLLLLIAAIALIGAAFLPVNHGAAVFFIYAAAFAPWVDRRGRTAAAIVALLCIALTGQALLLGLDPFRWVWGVVFAVMIGALNHHHVQTLAMNAKLRLAQQEIEQLAKTAERERIARDLHDVVGHTLSLIVLKSELASRLADREPERSTAEIRDVERIAREALAQVRAAISGYRAAGLARELENAREVLKAAGVTVTVEGSPAAFSLEEEAVLSLALRECVTNLIRHAHARRCTVAFERDAAGRRVIVSDDGRGTRGEEGFGVRGMRERLRSVGGALLVEGGSGTRISIQLPPEPPSERAS